MINELKLKEYDGDKNEYIEWVKLIRKYNNDLKILETKKMILQKQLDFQNFFINYNSSYP